MQIVKKALSGLLVVSMLAVGCSSADKSWVFEYDGEKAPAGVYITSLVTAAASAQTEVMTAQPEAQITSHKELLKQSIDGTPAADWIAADAYKIMQEYFAVENQFKQRGLELSAVELDYAKSMAASTYSSSKEFYEKNGVAEASVRLKIENSLKREAIFQSLYGEGGEQAVTETELKDIFQKDYAKIEIMGFNKQNADGTENTEAKGKTEGYLERLKNGEKFADLMYEQAKEAYGDEVEQPTEDDWTMIISTVNNTSYSEELVKAASSATVGEPVMTEDTNFVYIIVKQDILANVADYQKYSATLLSNLKSEEFDAAVEKWAGEVQLTSNASALSSYTAQKLKIDA